MLRIVTEGSGLPAQDTPRYRLTTPFSVGHAQLQAPHPPQCSSGFRATPLEHTTFMTDLNLVVYVHMYTAHICACIHADSMLTLAWDMQYKGYTNWPSTEMYGHVHTCIYKLYISIYTYACTISMYAYTCTCTYMYTYMRLSIGRTEVHVSNGNH